MGDGQATKILFPFEFSRLMEGASEYLGTARTVPDRSLNTLAELEQRVGTMDDILGPIPKQEELLTEIKSIEQEDPGRDGGHRGDGLAVRQPHQSGRRPCLEPSGAPRTGRGGSAPRDDARS